MTDLTGSYERGEEIVADILSDLSKESRRTAMSLEPVRLNSDEIYHILRTRLFETLPDDTTLTEVAQAYAKALRETKQMAITSDSPEQFAARVQTSYPFHPGLRDLYARFRENEGFQQTRGLIRLMRML
jgi:predicted AAA+ superfamily ATPase